MNERIRKLAEQARKRPLGDSWCYATPAEFEEKFAELIVRECAGACLHDDWEDPRWGRFYANKIREHFEVEE